MNTSLSISQSGLKGLQKNLDIVSNNIANVNTTGYKKRDSSFQELLLNNYQPQEVHLGQNADVSNNRGMKVTQDQVNFQQGGLIKSNNPYDLALVGNGFFGVRNQNNELLLTRDGGFTLDANRDLRLANGEQLELEIVVPKGQWPEGKPMITQGGEVRINDQLVARIPVYTVERPNELISIGSNRFAVPENQVARQTNQFEIQQGFLETSNVDLAEAMTDMIVTQRSYSMNAKVLQSTDEMMQRINEYKQ